MEKTPSDGPAQAVQEKQQQDAKALFEHLQQIEVTDLTVHYTLEDSSVTLPTVLIRLLTLAVLFRLNSANKWHAVFRQKLLPEPCRANACLLEWPGSGTTSGGFGGPAAEHPEMAQDPSRPAKADGAEVGRVI